jgi:CheY-like chemotaxis protein
MQTPRLILLDLMLSNESAFDILRWIRTEERYKDVPVFVLAPQVLNMDVKDAYALGANSCFIQKPAPEGLGPIARGIAAYASLIALSERACA